MRKAVSSWALGRVMAMTLVAMSCGSSDAPVGSTGAAGAGGAGTGGAGTGGTAGTSGGGGVPGDGGACSQLGVACTGTCTTGFHCVQGACVPDGRAMCGGFAGAQCPSQFGTCLNCEGCDYGVCFTEAEQACVCATASGKTAFPACTPPLR